MAITDIKEYNFYGYHLVQRNKCWVIDELNKEFKTSQEAERFIKDMKADNYVISVVLPKGTKERINALNLNMENAAFIRDAVLSKLDDLERPLK